MSVPPLVDPCGDLGTASIESFYKACERLFAPGGPGRIDVLLTDSQIVELLEATRSRDALFVVPTPAGIVGIRRKVQVKLPAPLDPERELRAGRHDRGYPASRRFPRLRRESRPPPLRSSLA